MSHDDERDYAEEAAVQRDIEVEGEAELAEERAQQSAMEFAVEQADDHAEDVAGHMSGPAHYLEAERLIGLVEAGASPDTMLASDELLTAAQVHATLALAAATAANIRRNGALTDVATRLDELHKAQDITASWLEVLG